MATAMGCRFPTLIMLYFLKRLATFVYRLQSLRRFSKLWVFEEAPSQRRPYVHLTPVPKSILIS